MTPEASVETFPPDRAALRRDHLRFAALVGVPVTLLFALFVARHVSLASLVAGTVSSEALWRAGVPTAGGAAVGVLLCLFVPRGVAARRRRALADTLGLVTLDAGERLEAACLASLPGRVAPGAALLVTDRRLLVVEPTASGYRLATLGERVDLASADVAHHHATRVPLLGALLALLGVDRTLALSFAGGEGYRVWVDEHALDPLAAWLAARGVAVGRRNDADLAAPPRAAPVAFDERAVPRGARRLGLRALGVALVFGAGVALSGSRPLVPVPPPAVTSVPFAAPRFPSLACRRVFLAAGSTQVDAPGSVPPPPGALVPVCAFVLYVPGRPDVEPAWYQVRRAGRLALLCEEAGGGAPFRAWELLGDDRDLDAALHARALGRLRRVP